jgi:UDP-N-acetylglucosamine pyrophosphorylase
VPIYVVCNEDNFYEVKQHFVENNYFGVPSALVQFYVQQNIPILDEDGHIVLKPNGTPVTRPGGAGTIISTFLQSNFLNKA